MSQISLSQIGQLLEESLRPRLDAFSGDIGASLLAPDGSVLWHYADTLPLQTASTIKLFVLGAFLQAVEEGRCTLEELCTVCDAEKITGSGVLRDFKQGARLSAYDIALLMMVVSDNTATNLLIDCAGGLASVQEHMRAHGMQRTVLNRKFSEDPAVMNVCEVSRGCTADFVSYLYKMHSGQILNAESLAVYDLFLERQHYKNFVPAHLPLAEDWPECWPDVAAPVYAACKTGWMTGIRCDVGYLTIDGAEYTYAVLSENCSDLCPNAENEGTKLLAECGRAFYGAIRAHEPI